jgi:hypothetical protein
MKKILFFLMSMIMIGCSGTTEETLTGRREQNLNAQLILVGQVQETDTILLSDLYGGTDSEKGVLVVKVLHVVKGYGIVNPDDEIRVIYYLTPKAEGGGVTGPQGAFPVAVEEGDLVVGYLDPSTYQGFYQSVAGGASVAVIAASR